MIGHSSLRGILFIISAMVFLPIKDGMAKILGGTYPPLEIIWAQFCLVYMVLVPVIVHLTSVSSLSLPPPALYDKHERPGRSQTLSRSN